MEAKELMENIVKVLDSKKAKDIRVIRIGDLTILGEYFVIATGTSSTQVKMLADEVDYQLGEKGVQPHRVEGYHSENWIILDYTDVIVHIFHEDTREFYDLERLWADGEKVDLSGILKD
mgnify:FL=1